MLDERVPAIANFFELAANEEGQNNSSCFLTIGTFSGQRFLDFARNDKRELAALARNLATAGRRSYI